MTYKECIIKSTDKLAKNPAVIFLGYNVKIGMAGGTLKNVPEDQLFETPVAENLMSGIAIGLSLEGFIPVVYYERFDFILNALDAIVNHLDKIEKISKGEFKPKVIFRVVVGMKNKPFYTGITHTQDFTEAMKRMVSFPIIKLTKDNIEETYQKAIDSKQSIMIIEEKELYEEQI